MNPFDIVSEYKDNIFYNEKKKSFLDESYPVKFQATKIAEI